MQSHAHRETNAHESKAEHAIEQKHKGVMMIDQLFRQGLQGAALLDRVAELIALYPQDKPQMAHYVNQVHGLTFWKHAEQRASKEHYGNANKHDIQMDKFQPHKKDDDVMGNGNPDVNRLTDQGTRAIVHTPSFVYDDMGNKHNAAPAGEIKINTAAVSTILIDGVKVECVFGFKVGGNSNGWVRVDCLDPASKQLVAKNEAIAGKVEHAQAKGADFSPDAREIHPTPTPAAYVGMFVMPHQTGTENEAEHYFQRGDGSVNLCFNTPGSGSGRLGVASDRVADGAKFYESKTIPAVHSPLYKKGSNNQSGKQLTFVYGKVVNSAGAEQYGWITKEQLG